MSSTSSLRVVQLSDTHLFSKSSQELLGLTTAESLIAVLNAVRQLEPQPDILLLTGDLSQDESSESYLRLRELVASLEIPTYWVPGNHDQLLLMERFLCSDLIRSDKVVQQGDWNFILLNSQVDGKVYGELSADSLDWLDQQLQRTQQPTLIALHHPPCLIGSEWMDQIGLRNPEELFAVIDRYDHVKLVLFGHIHQEFEVARAGVSYLGCPSTCVQFKPKQNAFAVDEQRPGFRVLTLHPDGSHHSLVKRVNYRPLPNFAATGY